MSIFQANDMSGFVFARKHLLVFQETSLSINTNTIEKEAFEMKTIWNKGLAEIYASKTRFGRVALCGDIHNVQFSQWTKTLDKNIPEFNSTDKRALKTPELHIIKSEIITTLANQGWEGSVEFRRIARKYIRKAKQANVDVLFFVDPILGTFQAKKVLQHIAGQQIKVVTSDDFYVPEPLKKITLKTTIENKEWVLTRAEQILQRKISTNDCIQAE